MKGEVKDLEGRDGRLLDCINPAFGIIVSGKLLVMGYVMGSQFREYGGFSDTAPNPQYNGHGSLLPTQSTLSEHETYHSSPSNAKTENMCQFICTIPHNLMAWCLGIEANFSYPLLSEFARGRSKVRCIPLDTITRNPVEIESGNLPESSLKLQRHSNVLGPKYKARFRLKPEFQVWLHAG
jgi:hypothetical protein